MRLTGWFVLLAAAGCVERVPEVAPDLDAGLGVQDGSERPETTAPGSGPDGEVGADSAGRMEPMPVADGAVAGDAAWSPDGAIAGSDGSIPGDAAWPPDPADAGEKCEWGSYCFNRPSYSTYTNACPERYPYCCPWGDDVQVCSSASCLPLSPPGCVHFTDAGAGYCTGEWSEACTVAERSCGGLFGGYGLIYDGQGRVIDLINRRAVAPPQELKACVLGTLDGLSFTCFNTVYFCREVLD